jgi:hypothetical protein
MNLPEILQVREPAVLEGSHQHDQPSGAQTLESIHGHSAMTPQLNFHPGSGVLVIVGQR